MVSGAVIAAIITLLGTALIALIGWLYKRRKYRLSDVAKLEDEIDDLKTRNKKLFTIIFGRKPDDTDDGLVGDIDEGFSEMDENIQSVEAVVDDNKSAVRSVVVVLENDEDVDFDRDEDLPDEVELAATCSEQDVRDILD